MSGMNLSKPCGVTNSGCLLQSHGNLSFPVLLLLLSLHFGCLWPTVILNLTHSKFQHAPCVQGFSPPTSTPPTSLHQQLTSFPRTTLPSPLQACSVFISLPFPSLCLACWFNQFDQMTFLAAEKRKPGVS